MRISFRGCHSSCTVGSMLRQRAGGSSGRSPNRKSSRKSSKSERSKRSERSADQKNKDLKTGLSPPKERRSSSKEKRNGRKESDREKTNTSVMSNVSCAFDKTQWERTRFAAEAAGETNYATGQPIVNYHALPGEDRQELADRGEYLKHRPKLRLAILGAEAAVSLVSLLVWASAAASGEEPGWTSDLPRWMICLANLVIIFLVALAVIVVEVLRVQVKCIEEGKMEPRWIVPYRWRYQMCVAHISRAGLILASLTLMAMDEEWDTGSIVALVFQPLHLSIVGFQIAQSLKPKAKQG